MLKKIKEKPYSVTKRGHRGLTIQIPRPYADRHGVTDQSKAVAYEDEQGNLVFEIDTPDV